MFVKAPTRCALCLEDRKLHKSHIIPAFVARHLKDTSATGYLISAESNARVQGLPTDQLLCSECEQRFSLWEKEFSSQYFPKIQADPYSGFDYGPSLLKFAVSLSWRVLITDRAGLTNEFPSWKKKIDSTLENWRRYLLGYQKNPLSVHHLFVLAGSAFELPSEAHPKTLQYLMRAVDATELIGSTTLAVYSKLLRALFYSPLFPANPAGWEKTRIHSGPGSLPPDQVISMLHFGSFLQTRVNEVFNRPLTERQMARIRDDIRKNPERALNSESFKVNRDAQELWDIANDELQS